MKDEDFKRLSEDIRLRREEINKVTKEMREEHERMMELQPRTLSALASIADRYTESARVGRQVVADCNVFGMSIWKRNEDGEIERVDPASVVFQVRDDEISPGGSFPAHNIKD